MADVSPRSAPLQRDESAGAVDILHEAVGLLPRLPFVLVLFVVVAVLHLLPGPLGDVGAVVGNALAVSAAYDEIDGNVDVTNSTGVRLLLALLAGLVVGVVTLVGLVFLVVPGVYLLVRLRLVVAAVMLEDSGPLAALGRSFELTRSHSWTVFGVWALPTVVGLALGGVVVVLSGGVTLAGEVNPETLRSSLRLAGAASALIVGPVTPVADAVMYQRYSPDRHSR